MFTPHRITRALAALATFAAALLLAAPLGAQQSSDPGTGTLEGTVVDAASGAPLADVVLRVEGTARGAMTDAEGRYRVAAVPAGRHAVLAQRVGYGACRDSVTIVAGAATRLDLRLGERAVVVAPVVVSATREAQRRSDGTSTIELLDGAEVRRTRAAHPAQLMNRLAGVHVSELAGEGHSTAIRQPLSTKPLYLYLEDGVPTRSTGFFNHNALYEVNLPQSGGLEVLKGPGTALYGSDAIGGVVNVLTRPAPARPGIETSVEGGAHGYARLLATGGFTARGDGLRADLNLTRADGWRRDAAYERQSGTVRWDHYRGAFSARTVVTGSRIDQQDVPPVLQAQFDARSPVNRAPIAFRQVDALRVSSALEVDHGATLWSVTPYARRNTLSILPNWQLTYNQQVYTTRNQSVGALAKVRRDFAPLRARAILGADVDVSPGTQVVDQIAATKSGPDSAWTSYVVTGRSYDYAVTYHQLSPYLHLEASPVARLRVDAGARYDVAGYAYDNHLAAVDTGRFRRPADTRVAYRHLSPKLGATLRLARAANVYAAYRHGFRAPNQSALFQQGAAANTVGLKPVKVDSREAGLRGEVGARLAYQLAAYDMTIRDDIFTFRDERNQQLASNAGETRHRGLEGSLGLALLPTLKLDAAYSVSDQRYVTWLVQAARPATATRPATPELRFDGNRVMQAPRDLSSLLLAWSPRRLGGGRLAVEYAHTGRYAMDERESRFYGGHELWNLHANAMLTPRVELFARVSNLLDRNFAELATWAVQEARPGERATYNPGAPRQLHAGMRYEWSR